MASLLFAVVSSLIIMTKHGSPQDPVGQIKTMWKYELQEMKACRLIVLVRGQRKVAMRPIKQSVLTVGVRGKSIPPRQIRS